MNLTIDEIIDELLSFYSKEELEAALNIKWCNIKHNYKKIQSFFNGHIEKYKEVIKIEDLFNIEEEVLIDTPDGFIEIGELFIKERDCIFIILENSDTLKCSTDHLIETNNGWKYAKDLSKFDKVFTRKGLINFKDSQILDRQKVYDMEVLSDKHRYWSNNISSHNTSKTFTAAYTALKLLADRNNNIKKIICTKPIQESGEKLGHLPGTVEEKIQPFVETFRSNFDKIIEKQSRSFLESVEQIEYRPLAYMRGATFDNAVMILDEAQNANFKQLMLFITRMGKDSKVIISGDVSQYDIKFSEVGLPDFIEMLKDVKGIASHQFQDSDIVRSKILIDVVNKYQKWKYRDKK